METRMLQPLAPHSVDDSPLSPDIINTHVLVVDDHPTFCMGVSAIIRRLPNLDVCGEAYSAETALGLFRELKPDIVVMDVSLPDGDGIELTETMMGENHETHVLILSMYDDPMMAARAMRAGASGYLRKDDQLTELATALQRLKKGKQHMSPPLREENLVNLLGKPGDSPMALLQSLTCRERDIFVCMGKGMKRAEIAEHLKLSVKTVDTHRCHVMKKLALPSTSMMARLAREWLRIAEATQPELATV